MQPRGLPLFDQPDTEDLVLSPTGRSPLAETRLKIATGAERSRAGWSGTRSGSGPRIPL